MTIKNVKIGDRFKTGRHTSAHVVDFYEVRSLTTGEVIEYKCIAKSDTIATNSFEVPFSTVVRNKI